MNRPWFDQYPAGVPRTIDTTQFNSLIELCDAAWTRYAGRPAFSNYSSAISFADVEQKSAEFAAYLQHHAGIEKGDRVAIMMPNILQYPIAMLGILRAGATVVNTNPQYTTRELVHQLNDSGARVIVAFRNMLETLHEAAPETSLEAIVVTELGDLFSFPKSLIYNRAARRRAKIPNLSFDVPVSSFNEVLKVGSRADFAPVSVTRQDLAFLQYTGGTTGLSKGAMLSHGNVIANIMQVCTWFGGSIDKGEEKIITALPLYHIYALTVNCLSFFCEGGCNYLITDPRDTASFIKELSRIPFTGIAGVNTLFNSLLSHEHIGNVDFSHLKYTSGGGAAIQSAVANAWERLTGKIISEGYGLTEASPVVCVNPFEVGEFSGCIGIPVPSTDCKIVDESGVDVGTSTPGELYVRGPQVMQGYWQRPDATAEVIDEQGWLRTGDIAVMHENGYFKIVDRKKDMILVSGFNVYPNEIEDVAVMHPDVAEAAAIGLPDEKTGECVKLVLVPQNAKLDPEQILKHCREHLTPYKVPRLVEVVESLPKSNIGKILRREVREQFGS